MRSALPRCTTSRIPTATCSNICPCPTSRPAARLSTAARRWRRSSRPAWAASRFAPAGAGFPKSASSRSTRSPTPPRPMSSSSASSSSPRRARSRRSPTSATRPTFRVCASLSTLSAASTPTSSWPSSIARPRCRIRSRATLTYWSTATPALWACARSCTSGSSGVLSPRVAALTLTWAKSPSACTCCTASRRSCSISTRPSPSSAAPSSKPRSCPTL